MTRDPIEPVLARLDGLAFRLERGECPATDEMDALADVATAAGVGARREDRERLAEAVARVSDALARSCARLDARIATTAVGKRAVRAYSASAP